MGGILKTVLLGAVAVGVAVGSPCAPQPPSRGTSTIISEKFPGAKISYKETSICETTAGVKSYSGYVVLPKSLVVDSQGWGEDDAAHLFFWYFEARNSPDTAPTAVYLGGGPGASSLDFATNFPCSINPDSNSTTINELSWNNHVNILYVDQPVGAGFSYISLLNGTMDLTTSTFTASKSNATNQEELNSTMVKTTLDQSFQQPEFINWDLIPKTTLSVARTTYNFMQVWFNEFPDAKTSNDEINIWSHSYGGFYGPAFISHWLDQNELIAAGQPSHANDTVLNLGTLGLTGPCMDALAMGQGYPVFAFNNTYGIELYEEEVFEQVMELILQPETGCNALIDKCRLLANEGDPLSFGMNQTVNAACGEATNFCFGAVQNMASQHSDRAPFDITFFQQAVHPALYKDAFFNQAWVQEELGVPLNFTAGSESVVSAFFGIAGDPIIRDLASLEDILARGINVAIATGDRDYRCNWIGSENVTLSLNLPSSPAFRAAGYAPIITNSTYQGGLVREHGNMSFSRIFQAGHGVSAYQPETMYHLFERAVFGRDVATGEVQLAANPSYATDGLSDILGVKNEVPEPLARICYVYGAPLTCTPEEIEALRDGTAVTENFVLISPKAGGTNLTLTA